MNAIEDRPTLPERYVRAIDSTHLEMNLEERCSVDMLVAAGWIKDSLGTGLYRLRAEFDSVRAAQHQAQHNLPAGGDDAHAAALAAKVMILVHLKSLPGTVAALGRFSALLATRERYMKPDAAVAKIAGRALDAWLDPLCPRCNGTGQIGEFGAPRMICTSCHGAKVRQVRLAEDEAGHQFGRALMNRMDSKCDWVSGQMRRYLSQRG